MAASRKAAIEKLKKVLLRRREALRKALAGDLSLLEDLRGEPGGDEIDAALDSEQREINSQLLEIEARELAQVENALKRMEEGTYGICEVTGKPIPLARLQALPYATRCVEAQRELERYGEEGKSAPNWDRILEAGSDDAHVSFNDLEVS